jgi:hypothetical protein
MVSDGWRERGGGAGENGEVRNKKCFLKILYNILYHWILFIELKKFRKTPNVNSGELHAKKNSSRLRSVPGIAREEKNI